jgi:branched-chain amino acid transport system substrate-binding protein
VRPDRAETSPALTRRLVLGAAAALAAPALVRAQGTTPIRVGEINSYTAVPTFTLPYRQGWQMALDEVNAAGGVLGRPLAFESRDDAGKPQDAVRLAAELVESVGVDLLAGTYLSNVGLAVSDYALQRKRLFVAGEPLTDALIWSHGNRYTYRLRPGTYEQAAMLVEEAAKLPARRWATVAPNYEYGQSAVADFQTLLKARRPDVEFVAAQWPALGKIDAGSTVEALAEAKPDALFNALFGADLTAFVRQGNTRGLFEGRAAASMLTGEPEYLDALGDETPEGWIVTGYPWDSLKTTANTRFADAYAGRFKAPPRMGSVVGYALVKGIAAGIAKSGSVDAERMAEGFGGAQFETPFGAVSWRALDHQSTLGTFVGRLAVKGGRGVMVDWRYVDGSEAMPADGEVRALRAG